jgi:hypothetical protein
MTRALIMTSVLLILAGFISTRDDQRAMGQNATPQSIQNRQFISPSPDAAEHPAAIAQKHVRQVSSRLKTLANALGIDTTAHVREASALSQISE